MTEVVPTTMTEAKMTTSLTDVAARRTQIVSNWRQHCQTTLQQSVKAMSVLRDAGQTPPVWAGTKCVQIQVQTCVITARAHSVQRDVLQIQTVQATMLYAQFRTTTTASIVTITTARKAVLLTQTALSPTQSVGQSSLIDVDVLLILTARLATPALPLIR